MIIMATDTHSIFKRYQESPTLYANQCYFITTISIETRITDGNVRDTNAYAILAFTYEIEQYFKSFFWLFSLPHTSANIQTIIDPSSFISTEKTKLRFIGALPKLSELTRETSDEIDAYVFEKVTKLIQDLNNVTVSSQSELYCPFYPNEPLDCRNIAFNFASNLQTTNLQSLSKIHKLVKCNKLYINTRGPLLTNVLGLLLMQQAEITFSWRGGWIDIIKKHLDSERDVIDCQQDLIEAGFKLQANL